MTFAVKVEHYISEEAKVEKSSLFVMAKDMHDVINKMNNYFESIESISIEYFSPDDFILFDEEDKHLFEIVKYKLEKKVIW